MTSLLMKRLAEIEKRIIPAGRGIVIYEDVHAESIEARKERCFAEVGGPYPGDTIIILRDFSDPTKPRGPNRHPAWRVSSSFRSSPP